MTTPRPSVTLSEWSELERSVYLTEEDRSAIERLPPNRINIDELRTGIRVKTRSWVGVLQLPSVEIRVVPKLAGEYLGLVRLLDFASGFDAIRRVEGDSLVRVEGESLLDLLASLFVNELDQLLKRGVATGYSEHELDLGFVRGRILADSLVLRRFGRVDLVPCRFDELEHDVLENKVLLTVLEGLARYVRSDNLLRRVRRLRALFERFCRTDGLDLRAARSNIVYHRLNSHYRIAHGLGWIILDGLGIDELQSSEGVRSIAFLLDMNNLFEQFIRRLFERLLEMTTFRSDYHLSHSMVIRDSRAHGAAVRLIPDILIRGRDGTGFRLPIDAKYKRYSANRVSDKDLYQSFVYAYGLSIVSVDSERRAAIVYPAETHELEVGTVDIFGSQGLQVQTRVVGIPIVAVLNEIEDRTPNRICGQLLRALGLDLQDTVSRKFRMTSRSWPAGADGRMRGGSDALGIR